MENTQKKQFTTRTGYVAADAKLKVFESGRKVANVTILSGSGNKVQATYIRGWNTMADRLEDIKKGEKWEFKGELASETREGKSYEVLTALSAYPHVKLEVQGEVKHMEDKELSKTSLRNLLISTHPSGDDKNHEHMYNIELYGEKNMARAKDINIGDVVFVKGHVRIYDYLKDGEKRINKSFQNPLELNSISIESVKEQDKKTGKATKKKKSGKNVEI